MKTIKQEIQFEERFEEARIEYNNMQTRIHIVGVPIIENCTRVMEKQVCKSQLFRKESLTKIQDKMRNACIKSFNKFYDMDIKLKEKQKRICYDEDNNYKIVSDDLYTILKKTMKNLMLY